MVAPKHLVNSLRMILVWSEQPGLTQRLKHYSAGWQVLALQAALPSALRHLRERKLSLPLPVKTTSALVRASKLVMTLGLMATWVLGTVPSQKRLRLCPWRQRRGTRVLESQLQADFCPLPAQAARRSEP